HPPKIPGASLRSGSASDGDVARPPGCRREPKARSRPRPPREGWPGSTAGRNPRDREAASLLLLRTGLHVLRIEALQRFLQGLARLQHVGSHRGLPHSQNLRDLLRGKSFNLAQDEGGPLLLRETPGQDLEYLLQLAGLEARFRVRRNGQSVDARRIPRFGGSAAGLLAVEVDGEI